MVLHQLDGFAVREILLNLFFFLNYFNIHLLTGRIVRVLRS
jgi:hypothetical protein